MRLAAVPLALLLAAAPVAGRGCDEIREDLVRARAALAETESWKALADRVLGLMRMMQALAGGGSGDLEELKKRLEEGDLARVKELVEEASAAARARVGEFLETLGASGDHAKKIEEFVALGADAGELLLDAKFGADDPAQVARDFKKAFRLLKATVPGGTTDLDARLAKGDELAADLRKLRGEPSLENLEKAKKAAEERGGDASALLEAARNPAFLMGAFLGAYGHAVEGSMDAVIAIADRRAAQDAELRRVFPELGGKSYLSAAAAGEGSLLTRLRRKILALEAELAAAGCDPPEPPPPAPAPVGDPCSSAANDAAARAAADLCAEAGGELPPGIHADIERLDKEALEAEVRLLVHESGRVPLSAGRRRLLEIQEAGARKEFHRLRALVTAKEGAVAACHARERRLAFTAELRDPERDAPLAQPVAARAPFRLRYSMCRSWDDDLRTGAARRRPQVLVDHPDREGYPKLLGALDPRNVAGSLHHRTFPAPRRGGTYTVRVIDDEDPSTAHEMAALPLEVQGPEEIWKTNFGSLELPADMSAVPRGRLETTYRGRHVMEGTWDGRVFDGVWYNFEGYTWPCDKVRGTYHWGRFRFEFAPDLRSFEGATMYCLDGKERLKRSGKLVPKPAER